MFLVQRFPYVGLAVSPLYYDCVVKGGKINSITPSAQLSRFHTNEKIKTLFLFFISVNMQEYLLVS